MPSKTEPIKPWLYPDDQVLDVYAIGFQELDLTAGALLLGDETRSAHWEQELKSVLCEREPFEMIASKQLVGMLLCVFVRHSLLEHVGDVHCDVQPVGIMGIMGNKGGVACRFRVRDSTFCFVNTHLNAHQHNVRRRNQDFKVVSECLSFATKPEETGIYQHEHLFWLGDLNYRIDLPDEEVRALVVKQDWATLFAADQLRVQMEAGLAFGGWHESPLLFAPSYKYDIETTQYDTSEKHRAPAWCDRVLYKGSAPYGETCTQQSYRRHELLASDHRPVSATFVVQSKRIVAEKRQAVLHDIVETLAQIENAARPTCQLLDANWQLEPVHFGVAQTRTFVLRNEGPGVAQYRFVPRPGVVEPFPPWLRVRRTRGLLQPNTDMSIEMTVMIDGQSAALLNMVGSERERLVDAILVLHLEHGVDFFISVSGTYQPSSFGCTLDYLVRRPTPIRVATPVSNLGDRLSVPKELWMLVDRLTSVGLGDPTLFQQSGDATEVSVVRELLDTSADFLELSATVSKHSIAQALLDFLATLAVPVVPFEHYAEALDAAESADRCRTLLQYIPAVHFRTFHYVTAMLAARVQQRAGDNESAARREAARLSALFGPVLIRPSQRVHPSTEAIRRSALFVAHFVHPEAALLTLDNPAESYDVE